MSAIEYRTFKPVAERPEFRAESSSGRLVFRGIGAVYYRGDVDGSEYQIASDIVERIKRGAFDKSLEAIERGELRVSSLMDHDPRLRLASTQAGSLRLWTDGRGLHYEATSADTTVARDVRAWIEAGEVMGSSFGFIVPSGGDSFRTDKGVIVRTISEAMLIDVGPVFDPAYRATAAEAASSGRDRETLERIRLAARASKFLDGGDGGE